MNEVLQQPVEAADNWEALLSQVPTASFDELDGKLAESAAEDTSEEFFAIVNSVLEDEEAMESIQAVLAEAATIALDHTGCGNEQESRQHHNSQSSGTDHTHQAGESHGHEGQEAATMLQRRANVANYISFSDLILEYVQRYLEAQAQTDTQTESRSLFALAA